jgi:hypothetical protein
MCGKRFTLSHNNNNDDDGRFKLCSTEKWGCRYSASILKTDASLIDVFFLLQRWQRRWFVLYDDGELNYSVDEHVSAVWCEGGYTGLVQGLCRHTMMFAVGRNLLHSLLPPAVSESAESKLDGSLELQSRRLLDRIDQGHPRPSSKK